MVPIQVRILQGSGAGRTRVFDEPQLAFGRSAENHIVIDVPEASRYHGALVFKDDQWVVINNSPNGTTVNNKKLTKKNIALKTGDVVGVGKFALLEVEIGQAPDPGEQPPAPTAATPATDEPAAKPMSGKSKLWIGIGVYFFLMLVGFIVLTQLAGDGPNGPMRAAERLKPDQIEEVIAKPLRLSLNERDADAALKEAQEYYQSAQVDLSARFKAYRAFKRADAYSGGKVFNDPTDAASGMNLREYKKCERELIDAIVRQYQDAYNYLGAGQWKEAERAFRELQRMYPDASSLIHKNAGDQIRVARARAARARG